MLAAYFGLEAKCWFDAGYDAVDQYQQVMSDMQSIVQDGARVHVGTQMGAVHGACADLPSIEKAWCVMYFV